MKILAIDTAEIACSAAIWIDGASYIRFEIAPRQHSDLILPMLDELLIEADIRLSQLDGLAFSAGPGSFTGLRIAAGVIQGLALGADMKVMPVSTLHALAQGCYRETGSNQILAALDARMGEVYWGGYRKMEAEVLEPIIGDQIGAPEAVLLNDSGDWVGAGSGWNAYSEQLNTKHGQQLVGIFPDMQCHAQDVASIAAHTWHYGHAVPAEKALPIYLRNIVAKKQQG